MRCKMPKTLLPLNESATMKAKDIGYRSAIPNHDRTIDFNPQTCDTKLLPYLANVYLTPYWDELWNEKVKRDFISELPLLHKRMGTVWSIKRAMELTGLSTVAEPALLKEGLNGDIADGTYVADGLTYAGGGSPFGYIIYLTTAITTATANRARRLIESFAPIQTRLVALVFINTLEANGLHIANGTYNAGILGVKNV